MPKNVTVFRLKTGKKRGTYTLTKGVAKKDGVLKNISYRPGTSSIYDEDNKDSVVKPKPVTLKFNNHANNPAVEITVSNSNSLLINFLKSHQKFGIDYEIYDEDLVAKSKVSGYNDIEDALKFVNYSDNSEIKASAMLVFGLHYFHKSFEICKADLKEAAVKTPSKILDVYRTDKFHVKYLSSLMYAIGAVKSNVTNTAVVWTDNEGVILHVVQGENPLEKLSDFLYKESPESQVLLQEFQSRLDKKLEATAASEDKDKVISAKDRRIAELEAQLAGSGSTTLTNENYDRNTLEGASQIYLNETGNEVPTRYKNDLPWIQSKLKPE